MKILISTEEIFGKFYDNHENISQEEILRKMKSLGYGPNRNKRFSELALYGDTEITREQWITKYTTKWNKYSNNVQFVSTGKLTELTIALSKKGVEIPKLIGVWRFKNINKKK